jgi:hypothetical protein
MAYQNDCMALTGKANRFQMDFGDQRASGVNYLQMALFGFGANGRGDAMGAEDHAGALGYLGQFIDENGSGLAKFIHNVAVMDDLFSHVNRRSIEV